MSASNSEVEDRTQTRIRERAVTVGDIEAFFATLRMNQVGNGPTTSECLAAWREAMNLRAEHSEQRVADETEAANSGKAKFEHNARVDYFMANVRGAIRIPAGTKPRNCTGPRCGQIIYDVPKRGGLREPEHVNATEKKVSTSPVSIAKYKDNPIGIPPTDTEDGAGINHFADCPDAQRFHRSKR